MTYQVYPATHSKRREHAAQLRNTLRQRMKETGKGPYATITIKLGVGDFCLLDAILADIESPTEASYAAMKEALYLREQVQINIERATGAMLERAA